MQVNVINGTAHVLPNKVDSCKQSGQKRRRSEEETPPENVDINIRGMAGESEACEWTLKCREEPCLTYLPPAFF